MTIKCVRYNQVWLYFHFSVDIRGMDMGVFRLFIGGGQDFCRCWQKQIIWLINKTILYLKKVKHILLPTRKRCFFWRKNYFRTAKGLSSDEFRIKLKKIRNSTKNVEFEFEVEFSLKVWVRPKSMVEFGFKLIKQFEFGRIWPQKRPKEGYNA